MEEQTQIETQQEQPEAAPQGTTDGSVKTEVRKQPEMIPYARFQEVVRERNQLQERLAAQEPKAGQPEKAAAAKGSAPDVDYAAQLAQVQAEVERLKAEAEGATALRTAVHGQLAKRLERVPAHIRDLLEPMEPLKAMDWLEKNEDQLMPRQAPETDAGKKGDRKGDTFLGSEEHRKEVRARFGMGRRT